MNLQTLSQTLVVWLMGFGLKVLGAVALWVIGRWLIHFGVGLITKALRSRPISERLAASSAATY